MKEQSELHIPLTKKLKSIPEVFGIRFNEEPPYEVLKKDGHFEVRRYQKQLMARVALKGLKYDDFRETAFKKLASNIQRVSGQCHLFCHLNIICRMFRSL